jgi:uncharacterized small protein (DUF1192 family)
MDRVTYRSIDGPGWEFSYPDAVAVAGNRAWVGNSTGSVTEVNATTGALIRVITASRYDLYRPAAITTRGSTVWIANSYFNGNGTNTSSVTEIDARTGALIRVITAGQYQLYGPTGIAIAGNTVWVANSGLNTSGNQIASVTEINARTGALIRVITAERYQLYGPTGIAIAGNTVWVANSGLNTSGNQIASVTEINARTGALIRVITAGRYQLSQPAGVATTGNTVWVANGGSVTEINARTGALIRVITGSRYQLNGLIGIAATGKTVWVATNPDGGDNQTVTEINAATGALIRVGSSSSLPDIAFAMTADRHGAWVVTNDTGGKGGGMPGGVVGQFGATTGALVRTLSQPILANSNGGGAITADGGYIWVVGTNFYDGAGWLAKFNAATGALVLQIIAGDAEPATAPPGSDTWSVVPGGGPATAVPVPAGSSTAVPASAPASAAPALAPRSAPASAAPAS